MSKETLTVRVKPETKDALDIIAKSLDRDRSYVVNEALAAYVETHRWQVEHIQQGLREAQASQFVPEAKVRRAVDRLRGT